MVGMGKSVKMVGVGKFAKVVGMGKSAKVVGIEEICQHDWNGGNLPR